MNGEPKTLELRLRVVDPVPGALGGMQLGSGASAEVHEWQTMAGDFHVFTVQVSAKTDRIPLSGKAVQKDAKGRFVYIVWRAGAIDRRAKVYLESITQQDLDRGGAMEIVIPGRAKDGLPCCATITPIHDWHVAPGG